MKLRPKTGQGKQNQTIKYLFIGKSPNSDHLNGSYITISIKKNDFCESKSVFCEFQQSIIIF